MGQALVAGWLNQGFPAHNILVVEPCGLPPSLNTVAVVADSQAIPPSFKPTIVIVAVKPQLLPALLPEYVKYNGAVFLSIAAGKPLGFYAGILGADTACIRAMPNTPAAIGKGITVCIGNGSITEKDHKLCTTLLEAVGLVEWIEDEAMMDAVTALSGSGPAYVFLLTEVMAAAGMRAGLPEALANKLARYTVAGAGEILSRSPETPTQLRNNVTSPNGTTAAALEVLMDDKRGISDLMRGAIAAAIKRSQELAKS
jgi:pyrroline-5-carboxylate reductase